MPGLPAGSTQNTKPNWVVSPPWPPETQEILAFEWLDGGGDWIRTSVPEGPDLQSGAFNRSATPPKAK